MNKLTDIFTPAAGNAISAATMLPFLKAKEVVHSEIVTPLREYLEEHKFHGVKLRLTGGHLARDASTECPVICLTCDTQDPNSTDYLDVAIATLESEIGLQSHMGFSIPVYVYQDDAILS